MGIREFTYRARGFAPIPLVAAALVLAEPTGLSFVSGLILVACGEAIRIWAVSFAGPGTRGREVGASELATSGPYAHLRNPIYLGNFIISAGLCVMAWAWMPYMFVVLVAAFAVQYSLIVSLEEEYLRKRFPASYPVYATEVPRFIPRRRPYSQRAGKPCGVSSALRSEKRTLQSIAALTLLFALRWQFG